MGHSVAAVDLPDPLENAEDQPLGDGEDLLSQLAGDAVNRMMADPVAEAPGIVLNPVQELTSQLDTFFEELRQRQDQAVAVVDAIPEAEPIRIDEQERAALDAPADSQDTASPHALFDPVEPHGPANWTGRLADRVSAPIESLSPASRALISATAIVSFLAACAALTYVLIVRS